MNNKLICLVVLVIGAIVTGGCGGEETAVVEDEETLAARVGDYTLTKEFLYDYIANLPEPQKQKYDNPRGRAILSDNFIVDELFHREAKAINLADKDWVRKQIDDATRSILVQAYFREHVDSKARPTEEEMREYYNEHQDVYSSLPVIKAQHIFSKSKEKLEDLKERVVEGGEKFTTLAHNYSEDKLTQADGGDLGYFNPGGYIRGIGYSEALNDTIFKMEPRVVYGPVKWEKGYSLIRVNEKRPAELRPFAEVKNEISDLLTRDKIDKVKREVSEELKGKYDWQNYMEDYYRSIQRTPAELFEYAQNTDDPYDRVRAFEEIIEKFPEDEYAPQAMFMIGFVHMEELQDRVSAEHYFSRLLNAYPDSDIASSARWMLDNMDKPLPEFEDVEDLNRKLSDDSN
jgi:hypothetical protein